jgi:hypothetical protein
MQRLQDSNLPIQRKTMAELQTKYQITQKLTSGKLQYELASFQDTLQSSSLFEEGPLLDLIT